ncbi:MAG TPA: WecB/TagA/CpsF family glycosyltransferase [Devosia sp.]|nr:WecB/TagA/CpsF family glycosyltransferase [Devosia sp.]
MVEALERVENFVVKRNPAMVFTPNAELIVRSQSETDLAAVYRRADLVTIDSYVAFYAARLLGLRMPEPVSAARLMVALLPIASSKKQKAFLLGAKPDVVADVATKLNSDYPGIQIVGFRDGYFKPADESALVAQIRDSGADYLFVAMSTPFKERFISQHLEEMAVPVSIGVGGTFDILAGRTRFAPEWISKLGLEWFYRFIQEPRRLWRRYLFTNLSFIGLVARALVTRNMS